MPPLPTPPFRLDLWTAPRPAGGTRVAFLVDPGGRAVTTIRRARFLEQGRSELAFDVAPDYHALAALAPQQGVVGLTRFVPTGPDSFDASSIEEWLITKRQRRLAAGVGPYRITAVPFEEVLLEWDLYRVLGSGGLATWGYSCTDRTPAEVLGDVVARLGYSWLEVGTVTPTTPVSLSLPTATPRAIADALVQALADLGTTAEFQLVLKSDLTKYRLELVTQIGGSLPALVATTTHHVPDLAYDEDALEQANAIVPFAPGGIDLRELQLEVDAVDGGTGWVTLQAIGGAASLVVAVADQFGGHALTNTIRLFRELTGRSFAIIDTSASPMRVQLATADLASGLAAGERVSFRASEDSAGQRRHFATPAKYSPAEVVSTLTSPNRIRTRDLADAGTFLEANNQLRDWMLERSTLVATLPEGDFNHVAGTFILDSAPAANPAVNDWIWFPAGGAFVPATVTNYDSGSRTITCVPRYRGHQFTTTLANITGVKCYRPVSTPMWIQATLTASDEFQVDAFTGGTPAATDVLEMVQRHQGVRLVELLDPAAITAGRKKVAQIEVACTGATNRIPNADMAAWAGASGDPPDGYSVADIVGTVTRSRETGATLTRYGGRSWKLDFAAGASGKFRTPAFPVHAVPGAEQVAAAVALQFTRFTGNVPVVVTLYAVTAAGARTQLGDAIRVYPPDSTATVETVLKAQLNAWYDASLTNQPIGTLGAEQLQLELERPAGASNLACTLYWDAAMLLHRLGLPEAPGGGVQWLFNSDALPMLTQANEVLLDRAYPLVRLSGRFRDLFRLDALQQGMTELVPGRTVTVQMPDLGLTRSVRLLGLVEDLDRPEDADVTLDRPRPDLARILADALKPPAVEPPDFPEPPREGPVVEVNVTHDATNGYIAWEGKPIVEMSMTGITGPGAWSTAPASPITIARQISVAQGRFFRARSVSGDRVSPIVEAVIQARPPFIAANPDISAVNIGTVYAPCDGDGTVEVLAPTVANMPVGTTYLVHGVRTSGTGGGLDDEDSQGGLAIGDFPITLNIDLCPGDGVRVTITADDSGTELDSDFVDFTA
jgi:hypothetical protein